MNLDRRKPQPSQLLTILSTVAAGFVLLGHFAGEVNAQVGKTVQAIDVQYVGNQSVSPDRIRSHMSTKVGDELSAARIDEDVKALYESGDVENVRMLSEGVSGGVRLIVVVQTRALYGGVEFQGNTLIEDDKLRRKVDLTVNKAIDERALQEARQSILEMYEKRGFSEVTVRYRIAPASDEGYSVVIYTIDEGTQGVLRDISFVGNTAFTEAQLREVMDQKERGLGTILGKKGTTDSASLAMDVRAIEDHYRDAGFLNAKVVNVAKMRVDAKNVDVVITIDEGDTYTVDSLAVRGVQALAMESDILPYLQTKAGDEFSGTKLKNDIELIQNQYGTRGYADARVRPRLEDAGNGNVRVVLDVEEGRQYKVGQIHIEGNDKTQDRVIRRELPINPGEPWDTSKTDVAQRRLQNMNYFSTVDIMPLDTSYVDEKDLLIRVTEKPTGSLNVGAGFSSIDSVTGFLEVTQANFDLFDWPSFSGAGQRFRLSLRGGNERRDFAISITEPWFMGYRLALTGEAFYRDLLFLSDQYDQTTAGGALSLRKAVGEHMYVVGEYRYENIDIDAEANASPAFAAEDGSFNKSSVGLDLVRDTRDNVFLPRKGHKVSAGFEFAGLGGDVDDVLSTVQGSQYVLLPGDTILSFVGRYARSSDGDQIFTRQFLGGANNLRGFDYRDVGLRDPVSGEVLGGTEAWYGSVEVTYPLVEKIRVAAFYDVGEVSGGPGTVGGGLNSDWGIGARLFVLGAAPVRLDYAFPLQTDAFNDDGGRFNFTIGAQF